MNLLVLALASSSDALFLIEPLAARRAERRAERVTLAAPPGACEVLKGLGLADTVWHAAPPGAPAAAAAYRTAALFGRSIRSQFDAVVDVFPHVRSTIAGRLAAMSRPTGRGGERFLESLLRLQARLGGTHDPVARIARALDVHVGGAPPVFQLDPTSDAWIERALGATGFRGGEPVVVVHSSGIWPEERFVDVAEGLRSHFEARLVALDTPREGRRAKAIAGALGGQVLGMVAPPAPRFLAAVARASAVVTDTPGMSYLAGVLRAPSVLVLEQGQPEPPARLDHLVVSGASPLDVSAAAVYEQACRLVRRERTGPLFRA